MRVCLVTHQFFPSFYTGVERLALNLASQLRRMGHDPIVLTSAEHANSGADAYAYDGIPVRAVQSGPTDLARPWRQDRSVVEAIDRILAEEQIELVHVMHPMRLPQAFDAVERRRIPVVAHVADFGYLCARLNMIQADRGLCVGAAGGSACISVCGIESGRERVAWGVSALARADAVVCPCRATIDRFGAEGFDTSDWYHVPWGVDYALHPSRLPDPENDGLVLGFIGTLVWHKGAHIAVEAVKLLPDEDITLLLYGGSFHEEAYENELRKLAGGDPRIRFEGSYGHDDLRQILAPLDAVVIPSLWHENLPTTGLNAVAAGVPVIVSDVGGMTELIDDYRAGVAFGRGDPVSLGDVLRRAGEGSWLSGVRSGLGWPDALEEEAWRLEQIYETVLSPRAVHA